MSKPHQNRDSIADEAFNTRPRFVRVTGHRPGFVEFDFAIGEPDIYIEMILPDEGFKDFCELNQVTLLEANNEAEAPIEARGFEWRLSDATGRQSDQFDTDNKKTE